MIALEDARPAHSSRPLHTHDYHSAIAKALEWLGDRYLLAKPIKSIAPLPAAAGARATRLPLRSA
jgi:hypothetical protein